MDVSHWIEAAGFAITAFALVWKGGAISSRLDTLLTLLTERVNDMDDRLRAVEKKPRRTRR